MIVNIEQRHINLGQGANISACPIALALNEKLPKGYRAIMGAHHASVFYREYEVTRITMPDEATKFVAAFDAYRAYINLSSLASFYAAPKPTSFVIDYEVPTDA